MSTFFHPTFCQVKCKKGWCAICHTLAERVVMFEQNLLSFKNLTGFYPINNLYLSFYKFFRVTTFFCFITKDISSFI